MNRSDKCPSCGTALRWLPPDRLGFSTGGWNAEFVKSLKDDDKTFVKKMLDEFEKSHPEQPVTTWDTVNQAVPDACKNCPNHPSNGGSGICHCILGTNITY